LKRAIQREIETPLAKLILSGEVSHGQSIYVEAAENGQSLEFQVMAAGQDRKPKAAEVTVH
jgi:ATP-dependent Clp protease ATP-binding subunit ClpA